MKIKFILRFLIMIFLVFSVVLGVVFGAVLQTEIGSGKVTSNNPSQTTEDTFYWVEKKVLSDFDDDLTYELHDSTGGDKPSNSNIITSKDKSQMTQYFNGRISTKDDYLKVFNTYTSKKEAFLKCTSDCANLKKEFSSVESLNNLIQEKDKQGFVSSFQKLSIDDQNKYLEQVYSEEECSGLSCVSSFFSNLYDKDILAVESQVAMQEFGKSISNLDKVKHNEAINGKLKEIADNCQNAVECSNLKGLFNNGGVCTGEFSSNCGDKIEEICSNSKSNDCNIMLNSAGVANKITQVNTNLAYDVISILTNPDQNALKASRLFGLDEKFNFKDNALYEVFGEPIPSNICIAKIDGYIDSEVSGANGGVTSYQFGTDDPEEKLSERALNVRYDLRAQMTKVTPDNRVSISYSYFLRAPYDEDLRFIIAISYVANGVVKKEALTDLKSVSSGSTSNGFENVELDLNSSNVDENSFQIGLIAVDEGKRPVYTVTTPVILITSGSNNYNINSGSGNSQGNVDAQSNSNSFGVEDMLNLI